MDAGTSDSAIHALAEDNLTMIGGGRAAGHRGHTLHHFPHHHRPQQPQPSGKELIAFYAVMIMMIGAQSTLFWWKKKHKRSYDLATLIGLWVIPPGFAIQLKSWRFLTVWFAFSSVTGYWLYRCTRKKMDSKTPRKVYFWFHNVYRISVALGVAGYALLILNLLLPWMMLSSLPPIALQLLWYGLYFGVMSRDCAEVTGDRMVNTMGTGRRLMSSIKACGMCEGDLPDFGRPSADVPSADRSVTLPCKHSFHRQCISGWTIVGKKDTCPQCYEKVDLRSLYADMPWQTTNLNWIQMLDAVRYMVVWFPIIVFGAAIAMKVMGLSPKPLPAQAPGSAINNATMTAVQ